MSSPKTPFVSRSVFFPAVHRLSLAVAHSPLPASARWSHVVGRWLWAGSRSSRDDVAPRPLTHRRRDMIDRQCIQLSSTCPAPGRERCRNRARDDRGPNVSFGLGCLVWCLADGLKGSEALTPRQIVSTGCPNWSARRPMGVVASRAMSQRRCRRRCQTGYDKMSYLVFRPNLSTDVRDISGIGDQSRIGSGPRQPVGPS